MNYKRIPQVCGVLFDSEFDGTIHDECGCTLPSGHHEPHEFIAADGQAWQWETDLSCDCDSCMEGNGDFCIVYWTKADDGQCEPAGINA